MRWIPVLFVSLALAGCVSESSGPDDATVDMTDPVEEPRDPADFFDSSDPVFCDSEDDCDFYDDLYHQYVVYDLDTTVLDVVIVPPAGASTPDNLAASRQAVQAWSDGIEELGQEWFTEAFEMNVHAVGFDVPSLDAVADPEIIVVSSSGRGLVGIGLEPKQLLFGCDTLGRATLHQYDVHAHGDVQVMAAECDEIGFTCFALNVGAADPRGLYDLIAHEVGHCLGTGHVGDALDFRAKRAPVEDIMSYQDNPEHVHCVSTLNVRNLEGVYAHLLDRPEEEFLPRGSFSEMSPWDYAQVDCANPPGM